MENEEASKKNNFVYKYIYQYAENLRHNSFFELSKKYYINCLSYEKNDKRNYYGLLYAEVKCPDDNLASYINNLKDFSYFQNIIAICKNNEEIVETLNIFINYVYEYICNQPNIDDNIYFVFDNMLEYYPYENNDDLCHSIEKIADSLLNKKEYDKAISYYSKYIDLNEKDNIYWKRMMALLNCSNEEELISQDVDFKELDDFKKVINSTENIDYYFDIIDEWKKEQARKVQEKIEKEEQEQIERERKMQMAQELARKREQESKAQMEQKLARIREQERNKIIEFEKEKRKKKEKLRYFFPLMLSFVFLVLCILVMYCFIRDYRYNGWLKFLSIVFCLGFLICMGIFIYKPLKKKVSLKYIYDSSTTLAILSIIAIEIFLAMFCSILFIYPSTYFVNYGYYLSSDYIGYSYNNKCYYGQDRVLYVDPIEELNIPEEVYGNVITYVYVGYSSKVKKIKLSNSVRIISDYNISGFKKELFSSLASLEFSKQSKLSDFQFLKYSNIKSISLPQSITKIEASAFKNCENLTNIELPNNITMIGDNAFYGCTGLSSISLPQSITKIEASAFDNCGNLTNIELPNNITTIGTYAFYGCTSISSITLPQSVKEIGSRIFEGCSKLNEITYLGTVYQWNSIKKYSDSFTTSPCKIIHCNDGNVIVR